ncbi:unnamed protein product [Paramecium sonneborni]|uniref:Uncharacterized protein n=1 Tax=Paramecium sonneborni TaxID=65129 RepID=A0A8S1KQ63_9CILI|nr:unnamed protein product [Paramecium sonneborni]
MIDQLGIRKEKELIALYDEKINRQTQIVQLKELNIQLRGFKNPYIERGQVFVQRIM